MSDILVGINNFDSRSNRNILYFRKRFRINIIENKGDDMVFELIGCDTSFANALRRILLSEVPTVAIENVYMWNNTSIIHDEVLAHRLGLIPINVDARLFDPVEEGDDATEREAEASRESAWCAFFLSRGWRRQKPSAENLGSSSELPLADAWPRPGRCSWTCSAGRVRLLRLSAKRASRCWRWI